LPAGVSFFAVYGGWEPIKEEKKRKKDSPPFSEGVAIQFTKKRPGAGDRDRTDDIQLGKLTFYH
jgi:hypothetical protein